MNKEKGGSKQRQKRTSMEALEGLLGGHLASADLIKDRTQDQGSIGLEYIDRCETCRYIANS
jgi:hypothetical protein